MGVPFFHPRGGVANMSPYCVAIIKDSTRKLLCPQLPRKVLLQFVFEDLKTIKHFQL